MEREARQLVEAAARWLSVVPDNPEYAAGTGDAGAAARARTDEGDRAGDRGNTEETLGQEQAQGQEHLCRGCPWCRARAAAGPIGADTLDSLAQLLGAAAESLSLFAQSRREAAGRESAGAEPAGAEPDERPGPDAGPGADEPERATRGEGVVDAVIDDAVIDWDDEDEDELLADEGGASESPRPPLRERKRP